MRKKSTPKVKPQSKRLPEKQQVSLETPPFHIVFPITLYHKVEKKYCYFQCEEHVKSYIQRYNLKPKEVVLSKTSPKTNEED